MNRSILVLAIVVLLWIGTGTDARYSGGTGEPNDPYQIATAEDLNDIGNHQEDWNKHFILVNDVNLAEYTGMQFKIIGSWIYRGNPNNKPFAGVFDGNDHKIWNFTWASTGRDGIGLFACVGKDGQIKNLGMENVNVNVNGTEEEGFYVGGLVGFNEGTISSCYSSGSVSGNEHVGGLAGSNWPGRIMNCYSKSSVSGCWEVGGLVGDNEGTISSCYSSGSVSGYSDVGGLVGDNSDGIISSCYSTGTVSGGHPTGGLVGYNRLGGDILKSYYTGSVSGDWYVGGLVGWNCDTITNCYSSGSVSGKGEDVGGLVGHNYGTISASYSTGNVSGDTEVGGLVGWNSGTIINCYSSTNISGTSYVGGLVGQNGYYMLPGTWPGWIYNCYSVGSVSGTTNVGGLVAIHIDGEAGSSFWDIKTSGQSESAGGTPKTTTQMKTMSTFTDAGWDFVEIWGIGENQTYPFLRQSSACDINLDQRVDLQDFAIFAEHWLEGP